MIKNSDIQCIIVYIYICFKQQLTFVPKIYM